MTLLSLCVSQNHCRTQNEIEETNMEQIGNTNTVHCVFCTQLRHFLCARTQQKKEHGGLGRYLENTSDGLEGAHCNYVD